MTSTVTTAAGKKKPVRKIAVGGKAPAGEAIALDEARKPAKNSRRRSIRPEERRRLIAVAAYYAAERRGFQGGSCDDDWLWAEREVDAVLATEGLSG